MICILVDSLKIQINLLPSLFLASTLKNTPFNKLINFDIPFIFGILIKKDDDNF